jgi:hypothetical protein
MAYLCSNFIPIWRCGAILQHVAAAALMRELRCFISTHFHVRLDYYRSIRRWLLTCSNANSDPLLFSPPFPAPTSSPLPSWPAFCFCSRFRRARGTLWSCRCRCILRPLCRTALRAGAWHCRCCSALRLGCRCALACRTGRRRRCCSALPLGWQRPSIAQQLAHVVCILSISIVLGFAVLDPAQRKWVAGVRQAAWGGWVTKGLPTSAQVSSSSNTLIYCLQNSTLHMAGLKEEIAGGVPF